MRRRRESPSVYLVLGEDQFLRDRFREEILTASVPAEAREFALSRFSLKGTSLTDVLRQAATQPMFAPRQVVVVTEVESLREDELVALADYLEQPPAYTVMLFEASKLDRRTRASRLLLEQCEVLLADSPDDSGAAAELQRFAREEGLKLRSEAAEELVLAVGNELAFLRQELEKLRTYVGERREITSADIAALVSPARKFSVFDLAGLLAERNRAAALARLRRLLESGENPVGIVGLLAWLYRQLLQAHALPPHTPIWKAAQTLRAPRSRLESLLRQARKFRRRELLAGLGILLEADVALKSSAPDPTAVLETVVMRLTAPVAEKARA